MSGSCAAAPSRSAAGGTLLANDPHLGFTAPTLWYLARLQLAYVLRKQEAEYRFAIPLLQGQFEPSEVEQLLRQELAVLGRDTRSAA